MRARSKNQGISVHAIAGSRVVCLGLDATKKAAKGLLGFAIQRREGRKKRWLQGVRYFETAPPKDATPGVPVPSDQAPIQSFLWGDYTAEPGTRYTYAVHPVYGKPGALRLGDPAEVQVTTEPLDAPDHAIFFNRGAAGSQAYSRRFGDHRRWYRVDKYGRESWVEFLKPGDIPEREAYRWLSRGLEEAVLGFIAQADGEDWGLRAAVYEFQYLPAIQAFAEALERGADVKIVYDAKQSGKDKTGPWRATLAALKKVGLRRRGSIERFEAMTIPRTITTISHNKFIVLLHKGEPVQVWTGSANMTGGGIFGQSNVGHIVRDPAVARRYYEYWQELSTDPATKDIRRWNVETQPDLEGAPPPDSITPIFSPRPTLGMLEWYADRLASAKSSVHFTAAFGVSQELAGKLMEKRPLDGDDPFLRYIMLESKPSPQASKKRKDDARAKGREAPLDYYDFAPVANNRIAWGALTRSRRDEQHLLEESLSGLDTHVEYLHTKYMIVDPLTDDPLVITGSANFSDASTRSNDENMLVIRGNTRVADIFLGEFMRTFNHFRLRNLVNEMSDEDERASFYLCPDDSWVEPYYREGSPEGAERLLFR
jgi:phosphatidylserine/phosphatidylglycerophosphate/cardiolipin synthase-like enzyme